MVLHQGKEIAEAIFLLYHIENYTFSVKKCMTPKRALNRYWAFWSRCLGKQRSMYPISM